MQSLAKSSLNPIEKKLRGIYSTTKERHEREVSTSNLVQILIQEATDLANLVSFRSFLTRFGLVFFINLDRQECILDGLLGTKREDGEDNDQT